MKWIAVLEVSNKVRVERFFNQDYSNSPSVIEVSEPFEAENKEKAVSYLDTLSI